MHSWVTVYTLKSTLVQYTLNTQIPPYINGENYEKNCANKDIGQYFLNFLYLRGIYTGQPEKSPPL